MAKPPKPHPKNASGPFYVEDGCCLSCDIPMSEAPGHFEYDGDFHCYVSCQPQTDAEITTMIRVAWYADLQCIRYRGTDANILRRFAELELRDVCDFEPSADLQPVVRNHVLFTIFDALTVTSDQLLYGFINFLKVQSSEQRPYKIKRIKTSKEVSSFEFSWFENDFHPVIISRPNNSTNECHVEYPLSRTLGDRGVGNVIFEWLQSENERFTNARWYTDDEWRSGGPSRPTLW